MASEFERHRHTICKDKGETIYTWFNDHYEKGYNFRPKYCSTCFRPFKPKDTERV